MNLALIHKATLRPLACWMLVQFSLLYIFVREIIFPLLNAMNGWQLPTDANAAILAATLTPPVTYILARAGEKIKGKADAAPAAPG